MKSIHSARFLLIAAIFQTWVACSGSSTTTSEPSGDPVTETNYSQIFNGTSCTYIGEGELEDDGTFSWDTMEQLASTLGVDTSTLTEDMTCIAEVAYGRGETDCISVTSLDTACSDACSTTSYCVTIANLQGCEYGGNIQCSLNSVTLISGAVETELSNGDNITLIANDTLDFQSGAPDEDSHTTVQCAADDQFTQTADLGTASGIASGNGGTSFDRSGQSATDLETICLQGNQSGTVYFRIKLVAADDNTRILYGETFTLNITLQ